MAQCQGKCKGKNKATHTLTAKGRVVHLCEACYKALIRLFDGIQPKNNN